MKNLTFSLFIIVFSFACQNKGNRLNISHLYCNKFESPLGVETLTPTFSWITSSSSNAASQSAYHILVADNKELLGNNSGNIWDSGKIESNHSLGINYAGEKLEASKKYYWKVKVWDNQGNESAWSEPALWQMGLLNESEWQGAQWIGYQDMNPAKRLVEGVTGYGELSENKVEERAVVPMLRKSFTIDRKIESATLFVSGLGHYEASINGEKVGDDFLAPGWTHYDETVLYNTYDVTQQLNQGANALGVIVGNGFHYNNRERYRKLIIAYGFPRMICKLQVNYSDGTTDAIVSDGSWQAEPSPITYSSIYGGEDYDARKEESGWNRADFDASGWQQAKLVQAPDGKLTSDRNYPVQVMDTFEPVEINQLNDSVWIYDFGQNASGIVSLKIQGQEGMSVQLRPGEVLKEDGFVDQRGSGSPYYYMYTLKGDSVEDWRPRFTYYGFRYVQVTGAVPASEAASELPVVLELKSLHTRNSMPQVGTFESSNERFNQIFTLINWAIKSNTQSVSTDCPTREKLGWIEQTHLMGESVHFNFNTYHLYKKLVQDMMDAQTDAGLVPNIVPEYINFEYYDAAFRDSPEWGIASIALPWMIYKWYGDESAMKKAWPMLTDYMDYLEGKSSGYILSHGLGDWYDIGPEPPGYAQLTPVELVATATYYHDAELMAQIARVLNHQKMAEAYQLLAEDIKEAFNERFYDAQSKVYSTGSQTALAMPLSLGLVPKGDEQLVLKNLRDSIHANNNAITAGDIGFHYLVDALTKYGASELIFEMNNRDDVPGYGYQLKQGATALAESWMALHSKSMNHLMLGHLMEWFYQGLGGIRQEEGSVGYKTIVIHPEIVEDIDLVNTSYESPYGTIKSNWEKSDDQFTLHVEVPFNTSAKVYLPFDEKVEVETTEGDGSASAYDFLGNENERMVYQLGSGVYEFSIQLEK